MGVIAAACTLILINRQVIEMRRQLRMTVDKERARVEIKALGMVLTRISEDFWDITATIELRNVGMGRAYVRLGEGGLAITDEENRRMNLDVVDGLIDPNAAPITETFYFFQPDGASRGEYSQKIFEGVFVPHISGFIEYETVGVRFHRDFRYEWVGSGGPLNFNAVLLSNRPVPETDEERVSFGFWSSSWINSGENAEYEMAAEDEKH